MSKSDIMVSICMPVYNGSSFLRDSILSVVNQTHSNLEILIFDDGSPDESVKIAQSFASNDLRIQIYQNESNLGLVPNWNQCLRTASGVYVKLHFQDDLMDDDCIERMLDLAMDLKVRLVIAERNYLLEDGLERRHVLFYHELKRLHHIIGDRKLVTPDDIARAILSEGIVYNFIGEPIIGLLHRDLVEIHGLFDDTLRQIPDFEYWLRITSNEAFGYIANPLHTFRVHKASQSTRNAQIKKSNNPTIVDRIHLTTKLNEHIAYRRFRDFAGRSAIMDLSVGVISVYVKKIGLLRVIRIGGLAILRFVKDPSIWVQGLWKDIKNLT